MEKESREEKTAEAIQPGAKSAGEDRFCGLFVF